MIYFINIELVYIDSYDIKERVYYLTIDKCIYKVVIHEKENNILYYDDINDNYIKWLCANK